MVEGMAAGDVEQGAGTELPAGMVVVVGGGTMGAGIAQSIVQAGAAVRLCEVSDEAAAAARDRVVAGLARADDAGAIARLDVVTGIGACPAATLAIEAVPEDAGLKRRVLPGIEDAVPAGTVIATNTSSLSVAAMADGLRDASRFVGMHFFNPVPRSALVEIVTTPATGTEAVAAARAWVRALGKEEIVVRDSPGFATSRLGVLIGLEAIRMVEEGVASPEDIDRGMVLGYRFPMGPLRLTDLVGLDVRLAIAEHLAGTLGERFEPPALLHQKVAAGELGKKSGKGFFDW
ncbi:MAG: 3-hydroxyacyl-CoA dehydrogenase family protein [Acidimicrobiales bacterium]